MKREITKSPSAVRRAGKIISLALCLLLSASPAAAIQDDDVAESSAATSSSGDSENSDLATLIQQWKDLDAELIRKEQEFEATQDPEQQEEIRGQFTSLVEQSEALVERIRAAAMAAFQSNPEDQEAAKRLVGIVMNDAEFGRNNQAVKLGNRLIADGIDGKLFELAAQADRLSVYSKELLEELYTRANQAIQNDLPQVRIDTSKGTMVVELFEDEAPNTVANFISLVEAGFYDGLKFHRVIEGFVAQGGDPNGNGSGGPGYSIACECYSPEARRHFLGSLSMAHAGKDTGGSQFFLCLDRTSDLDGRHTVFGRVTEGLEVLDKLSRNATMSASIPDAETDTIKKMEVVRKRDHAYVPRKTGDPSQESEDKQPPVQPETINDADDQQMESASEPETTDDSGQPADDEGEASSGDSGDGR